MAEPHLNNRVAIVTGAASGLGRVMALGLAKAGARVIALSSQSESALKELVSAVGAGRGEIVAITADVTKPDDCERAVGEALTRFGRIDIVVNNAGRGMKYVSQDFMTQPARFWDVPPDVWRMVIDTNVNGPFLMCRAAVPHMLKSGWGRLVNISMNYDTMKRRGFSPYGPSKAALESETVIWAQDLQDTGVTVNALLPGGAAETGMIPPSFPAEARAKLLRPEVMVPPLLWLASEQSNGFTGRRIIATEWKGGGDSGPAPAGWS